MNETIEQPGDEAKARVVAIVGRPNVGKSAVFNRIARKRIAIVHEQAGVTRDRLIREVYWGDQRFTLIDTGGIMNIDNERIAETTLPAAAAGRHTLRIWGLEPGIVLDRLTIAPKPPAP